MIWQVNISDKNEVLNERCIIFFKKKCKLQFSKLEK
jgi:hypothetical protein